MNLRTLLTALLIVLGLAACAKRNDPIPPKGEPSTYPRTYPSE
jgi:hypothetical protein